MAGIYRGSDPFSECSCSCLGVSCPASLAWLIYAVCPCVASFSALRSGFCVLLDLSRFALLFAFCFPSPLYSSPSISLPLGLVGRGAHPLSGLVLMICCDFASAFRSLIFLSSLRSLPVGFGCWEFFGLCLCVCDFCVSLLLDFALTLCLGLWALCLARWEDYLHPVGLFDRFGSSQSAFTVFSLSLSLFVLVSASVVEWE
jgi:hypothetical protein